MYYTIGEISQMFNLNISTLRYYDKEGLLPNIERVSGIRKFTEKDIETLKVIECLKIAGMEIKDIKQFMIWCQEGPSSYQKRKDMFEEQKHLLEEKMKELEKNMAMIKFKCWYYEQALKDGNENNIEKMLPSNLPKEIQEYYDISHSK